MKLLVTGAAGFIGLHTSLKLLEQGHQVVGLDNLNDYYGVQLKKDRLKLLEVYPNFRFVKADLADREAISQLFRREQFQQVIHLAAQAGVRYSLEAPFEYIDSNLTGTLTILEGCRQQGIEHLLYASSSSVYGMNTKVPFSPTDGVDHPVSLYAATKKSTEMLAHSYAHLYGIPATGLRFFTVYGPWGRPDMAPWLFTEAILNDRPIKVFNHGDMRRDFTYIDDIVEGVLRIRNVIPEPSEEPQQGDPSTSFAPHRIYNIGNGQPVQLGRFIEATEVACGKTAIKEYLPMQPGDVVKTFADVSGLQQAVGYKPDTDVETGMARFVEWYRRYQGI
ncbi:NAD-dependent epimerase [Gilvimarinus sp. SDUM040013]|uniref:NAD-dependent epimerase n=1 Tax=Gilvimarinus gilvus TaxID=3058038 RepID=A0ABU4RTM6_9GAMM|nr:NAD-dependent epimerase [Gilvimarinus sp. SDUM040013]MDO3386837.1 NAD-dependent epimerase [Gilvimarinus sp. SDUM040013]MDX6848233.1 NAD-dependent epimerase [Gilvimarinus sp. SDUM040013]